VSRSGEFEKVTALEDCSSNVSFSWSKTGSFEYDGGANLLMASI